MKSFDEERDFGAVMMRLFVDYGGLQETDDFNVW